MDFFEFLEEHRPQWPLGKIQAVNQVHHLAVGSPLAHPMQDDAILQTAAFVQVTVCSPASVSLPLAETQAFMTLLRSTTHEDATFLFDVEKDDFETMKDTTSVRILAINLQD